MKDPLDHLHLVPGGSPFVRDIRALVDYGNALDRELEPLHRKLRAIDMPLFGVIESTTPQERGFHFLYSLNMGSVSEALQEIATHRVVHHVARKYAAHMARLFLNRSLQYHAGFQATFNTPPEFRKISSGPLAVAWVSAGRIVWEHDAFPAVYRDMRPEPPPEHLRNRGTCIKYTEERVRNPDFKPPTADTVELDVRGLSRA